MRFWCFARSLLLLIALPIFVLFCSVVALAVIAPFCSSRAGDRWIRFWARGVLWLSGVDIRASGLENLKAAPAAVLVSNHLSHFDIPVLYSALPVSFRMVAKVELFRIPVFGRALRALGFVPVVRESAEGGKKAFQDMQEKFKRGESLWMAPEGTRFKGVGIGEFKLGAFYLALKANQPVIPICIFGTHRVLPKGSLLVNRLHWRQAVIVHVLSPILIDPSSHLSRHELRDQTRAALVEEFSRISSLPEVSP